MSPHRLIDGSSKPPLMDNETSVSSYFARVESLGGFLAGISYLNQDRRSDFAEAFVVDALHDDHVPEIIQNNFSHLAGMTVRPDRNFRETMRQLEQDIKSLLLVNPFVDDEQTAEDMRSYLAFKIMDRLDDIINDWARLDDDSVLLSYTPPKRFIGTHVDIPGQMIFYLLRSEQVTFVLYFCSSTERF